jgi:hypothetical protein
MLPDAPAHWRVFSEYWLFWRDFARIGDEERGWCRRQQLLSSFLDVYLGRASPLWQLRERELAAEGKSADDIKKLQPRKMGDRYSTPELQHMVTFVLEAVNALGDVPLGDTEVLLLTSGDFYTQLLENSVQSEALVSLVRCVLSQSSNSPELVDTFFEVGISFLAPQARPSAPLSHFAVILEVFKFVSAPDGADDDAREACRLQATKLISAFVAKICTAQKATNTIDNVHHAIQFLVSVARAGAPEDAFEGSDPLSQRKESLYYLPPMLYDPIVDWLSEHLEDWVPALMMRSIVDSIRSAALTLLISLVPGMPMFLRDEEHLNSLKTRSLPPTHADGYSRVSPESWQKVKQFVTFLVSKFPLFMPGEPKSLWFMDLQAGQTTLDFDVRYYRPVHTFAALRWFTPTYEQRQWLFDIDGFLDIIFKMMRAADTKPAAYVQVGRKENDWAKGALMDLFYHLSFEDNSQFVLADASESDDAAMALALQRVDDEISASGDKAVAVARREGKDNPEWVSALDTQQHTEFLSFVVRSPDQFEHGNPASDIVSHGAFGGRSEKVRVFNERHLERYYRLAYRLCQFSNSTLRPVPAGWTEADYRSGCFAERWASGDGAIHNFEWALGMFVIDVDAYALLDGLADTLVKTVEFLRRSGFGGNELGQRILNKFRAVDMQTELCSLQCQLLACAMRRTLANDVEDGSAAHAATNPNSLDVFARYLRDSASPTVTTLSFCATQRGPERFSRLLEKQLGDFENAQQFPTVESETEETLRLINDLLEVLLIGTCWIFGDNARENVAKVNMLSGIGDEEEEEGVPAQEPAGTWLDQWPSHAGLVLELQSFAYDFANYPELVAKYYALLTVLTRLPDCQDSCRDAMLLFGFPEPTELPRSRRMARAVALQSGALHQMTARITRGLFDTNHPALGEPTRLLIQSITHQLGEDDPLLSAYDFFVQREQVSGAAAQGAEAEAGDETRDLEQAQEARNDRLEVAGLYRASLEVSLAALLHCTDTNPWNEAFKSIKDEDYHDLLHAADVTETRPRVDLQDGEPVQLLIVQLKNKLDLDDSFSESSETDEDER